MSTNLRTTAVKASYLKRLIDAGFVPSNLEQENYNEIKTALGWSESTYKVVLKFLGKRNNKLDEGFRDYIPTEEEIIAVKTHMGAFGETLVWLGCRFKEMWQLRIVDGYLIVDVQKGGSLVKLNLSDVRNDLKRNIYKWIEEAETTTPRQIRYRWDKLKEAGLISEKCIPHSFRHLLISNLLESGVDIVTAGKTVGHCNIKTTYRYVHNNPTTNAKLREKVNSSNSSENYSEGSTSDRLRRSKKLVVLQGLRNKETCLR